MPKPGALSGITVIDLSRLLPGPYCSMILADHGARVIAIEDKRFLADGLFLNIINRNKEHMTLNLKEPEGKKIFFQLAEKADIVLEGFRPGVMDRLGVGYDRISHGVRGAARPGAGPGILSIYRCRCRARLSVPVAAFSAVPAMDRGNGDRGPVTCQGPRSASPAPGRRGSVRAVSLSFRPIPLQ